jgi:LytS/YehU family sensor histidine kinase
MNEMSGSPGAPAMEVERQPVLSARQIGVAAAFGGAALAVVLAGITIPIPGTPVVTDPRELFTTTGASLTGPVGGIVIGILAGIAEPGIPLASLLAHIIGGIYSGLVYKNLSYRFRQNNVTRLALWAVQVLGYYVLIVVPLFVVGLVLFYPDPEYGGFFALLGALEAGAFPEAIFTTIVTTIIMAALPERYRRPLW